MTIQILRTATPNNPPPTLAEGQLAIEMASDPPRLWCGVPTMIDSSGRIEVAIAGEAVGDYSTGDAKFTLQAYEPEIVLVGGDPLFEDVILLLANEQGPIGNTTTFLDQSPRERTVISDVGRFPIWAAPPSALDTLTSVAEYRAAGNYLGVEYTADWNFGDQPFCIEFYARPTRDTNADRWQLVLADNNGWFWVYGDAGQWGARFYVGGSYQIDFRPFGATTRDQWQHVAVYRIGNNFYGAKNGVPVLLGTASGTISMTGVTRIWAGWANGYNSFIGQLAGLRVTKGQSRYTAANFTPPPAPLARLPQPHTHTPEVESGWVLLDDGTIGDGQSNATNRANNDCEALFSLLWSLPSAAAIVVTPSRGASAADDWDAHKTITLPRQRGRAPIIAGQGAGLTMRLLGSVAGEDSHPQSVAELPQHNHDLGDPTHWHTGIASAQAVYNGYHWFPSWSTELTFFNWYSWTGNPSPVTVAFGGTGVSFANNGSGQGLNVTQPSAAWNMLLKL